MASFKRHPSKQVGLIFHSDRGSQPELQGRVEGLRLHGLDEPARQRLGQSLQRDAVRVVEGGAAAQQRTALSPGCSGSTRSDCARRWPTSARYGSSTNGLRVKPCDQFVTRLWVTNSSGKVRMVYRSVPEMWSITDAPSRLFANDAGQVAHQNSGPSTNSQCSQRQSEPPSGRRFGCRRPCLDNHPLNKQLGNPIDTAPLDFVAGLRHGRGDEPKATDQRPRGLWSVALQSTNRQARVSPPRSGLSWASPKGTDSGSTQDSRASVTVPVLRSKP